MRTKSVAGRRLVASLGAAVTARAGQLVLAVVLARAFGPSGYAEFTFAVGVATIAAQFGNLGWPALTNRVIPGMIKDRQWGLLKGFRDSSDAIVLIAALIGAAVVAASAALDPDLRTGLLYGALLVVPMAFTAVRRQQMAAVRLPAVGLMLDQGFAAIVTTIVVLMIPGLTMLTIIALYALVTVGGVLVTGMTFRRRLPSELQGVRREYAIGAWLVLGIPMVMGSFSKLLMNKTDILMLAPLSSMEEVGLFGAAFRLTQLMTFPQGVLMTLLTPLLSDALTHGNGARVRRLMRLSQLYAVATTAPVVLALVLAPEWVMTTLFGDAFRGGATTLVLLAIGQFAAAMAVSSSALLMMGGRERAFGAASIALLGVNVVLNLFLIPPYGAAGAAGATMISALVLTLIQLYLGRSVTRRALAGDSVTTAERSSSATGYLP